jgi:hypothetical protein
MSGFGPFDLGGLVAVGWVLVKVLGPVAAALARRIEGGSPTPIATDEPVVHQLREELDELHERVDFLERALVSREPRPELPQPRTPV